MHERRTASLSSAPTSSSTASTSTTTTTAKSSRPSYSVLILGGSFILLLCIFFLTSSSSSSTSSASSFSDSGSSSSSATETAAPARPREVVRHLDSHDSIVDHPHHQDHDENENENNKEEEIVVGDAVQQNSQKQEDRHQTHQEEAATRIATTTSSPIPSTSISSATSSYYNNNNSSNNSRSNKTKRVASKPWDLKQRVFCADIDPVADSHRGVKLFGELVTMFHACQLKMAWIHGSSGLSPGSEARHQSIVLFPPKLTPADKKKGILPIHRQVHKFPLTPFNSGFKMVIEEQDESVERREMKLHHVRHDVRLVPGVTLLWTPHYCCRHPTHFAEVLSAMERGLARWMQPPQVRKSKCPVNESDLCFRSIDRVVIFSANVPSGEAFNMHMIRAMLFGVFKRKGYHVDSALSIPILPLSSHNVLYERLVVPGALYDIFPTSQLGIQFKNDLREYLEHRAKYSIAPTMTTTTFPATAVDLGLKKKDQDEHKKKKNQKKIKNKKKRIVFLSRLSGRTIVDQDEFVGFLKLVAQDLTQLSNRSKGRKHKREAQDQEEHHEEEQEQGEEQLEECEVVVVRAGETPIDELYRIIKDAQILIGLHGADLTNMFLLPNNSAIIELNPVFFFEPRFFDLSKKMNVSYFSWNCISPQCAFGGYEVLFRAATVEAVSYTPPRTFTSRVNASLVVKWPTSGYVGEVCGKPCLDLLHSTSLINKFFNQFRSSNVRVGAPRHLGEIFDVLFSAFVKVGWILEIHRDSMRDRLGLEFVSENN